MNKRQVLERAVQRMRRSELSRCFYLWKDRFGEVDDYARKRRKVNSHLQQPLCCHIIIGHCAMQLAGGALPNSLVHPPICLVHLPISLVHLPIRLVHLPIRLVHPPICLVHLPISLVHPPISLVHLPISLVHLPISLVCICPSVLCIRPSVLYTCPSVLCICKIFLTLPVMQSDLLEAVWCPPAVCVYCSAPRADNCGRVHERLQHSFTLSLKHVPSGPSCIVLSRSL